jgi:hypothetical protein
MKDSAKITEDVRQEYHKPHCSRPNLDDATTAATTFSSSMLSLTPGTTASSSTDALIKYNADFQNALEKHHKDILRLIRNCAATSGRPAIPTKMISKVREANLATMKSINKKASRHGGKEITAKKIKELGAQAEKEAVAMFDAETKQNSTMEQEEPPLVNEQPQPPAPAVPKHWSPVLEPGFSVMQMDLDGNCFYRTVSDQLFHDEGTGYVIVRHQINNHIQRNREEFKNFLLLNDSNLELTDLGKYVN